MPDGSSSTTYTNTLTQSITNTTIVLTEGNTELPSTTVTLVTSTLTETKQIGETITVSYLPVPTKSPLPTHSPLPPRTPIPTRSVVPTPSNVPHATLVSDISGEVTYSKTMTETYSSTQTESVTMVVTKTTIEITGVKKETTLSYASKIVVDTSTLVVSETSVASQVSTQQSKKKNILPIIIGAAIGGLLLIIIIALVAYILLRKGDASTDSCVEMAEETVLQIPDSSTTAPLTNDNPLWTTSVLGDTDDPFNNDFEEDHAEGFFTIRGQGGNYE